jgi:hypothetical protein
MAARPHQPVALTVVGLDTDTGWSFARSYAYAWRFS